VVPVSRSYLQMMIDAVTVTVIHGDYYHSRSTYEQHKTAHALMCKLLLSENAALTGNYGHYPIDVLLCGLYQVLRTEVAK